MPIKKESVSTSAAEHGSRTAKMATFIFTSKLYSFLVSGLAFVVVARILGSTNYGIYTLALGSIGLFGALGDLGISTSVVKFIAANLQNKKRLRIIIVNTFAIVMVATAIPSLLGIIFSSYIAQFSLHNIAYTGVLQLAALTILFGALWSVAYSSLLALGKGKSLMKNVAVQVTIQAAVSAGLALAGFGAYAPIIGFLCGLLFGFVTSARSVINETGIGFRDFNISVEECKRLLKFTIPMGLSGTLLGLTSAFAIIVLGHYSTSVVLGSYGVATKISGMFDVVIGTIGSALLPLFSSTFANKKSKGDLNKYYNYALYFSLIFTIPMVAYLIILAKPLAYSVFGNSYTYAPLYLVVAAASLVLYVLQSYTNGLLVGSNNTMKVAKYNILSALVLLGLIPILLPTLNGLGLMLITLIIVPFVFTVLAINYSIKNLGIKLETRMLMRIIVAGIISALFLLPLIYFIVNYVLLLIVAVVEQLIVYPIVIALVGAADKERIEKLRNATKTIPLVNIVIYLLVRYMDLFIPHSS